MVVESLPQDRKIRRIFDGLRTKLNDMLDDSRVVFRRRAEDIGGEGGRGNSGGGINVPASAIVGFVMYLIVQAAGGIWWAATMQAKLDSLTSLYGQLWQKNEQLQLQINKDENGQDEKIRDKAREVLTDWGYIHVQRKNSE